MKGEKGKQMLKTIKGRAAQRRKGEEGFTLIELLVVIVILAILAAIVVFAVGGVTNRGQNSACTADANTIRTAEEAFYANAQSPGPLYGSEAALVPAYLAQESSLHNVVLGGTPIGSSYQIVSANDPANDCP
jgi:general secretion pathway protein G